MLLFVSAMLHDIYDMKFYRRFWSSLGFFLLHHTVTYKVFSPFQIPPNPVFPREYRPDCVDYQPAVVGGSWRLCTAAVRPGSPYPAVRRDRRSDTVGRPLHGYCSSNWEGEYCH